MTDLSLTELTEHLRKAREDAWDEGRSIGWDECDQWASTGELGTALNPYRKAAK